MGTLDNIIFAQLEIGPLANYIYFIGDKDSREVAVVDPAWEADSICDYAKKQDYKISAILFTHGHMDHVNGLDGVLAHHDVPIYVSAHEPPFYRGNQKNIIKVEDEQIIKIGSIEIECLLTPGHTPGGQCFRHEDIVMTGDTLFIDGCGRCDLPGGDARDMYYTLYETMRKWPDSNIVYPGHNYGAVPFATLGAQRKTNPYLTCRSLEEFLTHRMGISL